MQMALAAVGSLEAAGRWPDQQQFSWTLMADLTGKTVLIVEDEYYVAADTARALQEAGANVLGPCADKDEAFDLIANELPSAAVIDINLGDGADFSVAELLAGRLVPIVFMTGYDSDVIPTKFAHVPRLQKPVDLREIVNAVAKIVPASD